jgi:hypothetical protein
MSVSSPLLTYLPLEGFSDDILGSILLYCDFESACNVARSTSRALRQRSSHLEHVWKGLLDRHGFCFDKNDTSQIILRCKERRKLLSNLLQQKQANYSFNLPHRFFHFLPIVPEDKDTIMFGDEDSPPVFYECDSFVLTSRATSSELLLLNPFTGRLSIIEDCLDCCVASDNIFESEDLMMANVYKPSPNGVLSTVNPTVLKKRPMHQTLLGPDDYFFFDIARYFPDRRPSLEDFDVSFVGTDSKPILDEVSGSIVGNLVAVGRCVRYLSDESIVCTELTTWTRQVGEGSQYSNRMVCRSPYSFRLVDIDAKNQRIFVSSQRNFHNPIIGKPNELCAYMLNPWTDPYCETPTYQNCFPNPTLTIRCNHPITSFAIDATGENLVVATKINTLEIWQVKTSSARRIQLLYSASCLKKSIQDRLKRQKPHFEVKMQKLTCVSARYDSRVMQRLHKTRNRLCDSAEAHAASALHRQLARLQVSKLESIHLPLHLSIEKAGFVTCQHNQSEGSSLLLWRQCKIGSFEVVSLINLPLWSRRIPRVSFDGKRLIIFGQDHIGAIILIYQVACCEMPIDSEGDDEGDSSGGVYNFTRSPCIRFSNRVRHAALGGMDDVIIDSMHMTCNERFILVNTRTGNLLGASSTLAEGLIVIDLEDHK